MRFRVSGVQGNYEIGIAWVLPPPGRQQSILTVLLRAIYNHIEIMIQLLLRGGSTQGLGCAGKLRDWYSYNMKQHAEGASLQ